MDSQSMSRPASSSSAVRRASSRVPLLSSSTRLPSEEAVRTISTMSGWARGSPMPPKKTVSTLSGMVVMALRKVSGRMSPMISFFQLLRKHILQRRLQHAVGSM